jgi:EAL and modified HD-GYP domain-containing signal transduction protein
VRQHALAAAANEPVTSNTATREFSVARQPILDAQLRVVGYELLFRAPGARTAQVVDAEAATSSVIVDSFMEIGLDEIVGEHLAYLNVSRDFLMSVRPLPLPPGRVVLELLENQAIDDELLTVLRELVADGFTLALDDFRHTPESEPLLELASIVKLDVLALDEEELLEQVALLRRRRPRLSLLAEKVELRADFERCRVLGFDAFQGYFFARPSLTHGRGVPTQCLGALSAVSSLNAIEDFDSLEQIITRDVGLSLRLLRYANSAYVFLPRRVGSVREALIMLGARQVRRWATVVVLAGTSDAPHELLVTGLVRARMCQLLCGERDEQVADRYFTVGLFSVVDALVDAPMGDILATLPFSEEIVQALQERSGPPGELLEAVLAYERGDFDTVARSGLAPEGPSFDEAYREAVSWADSAARMLG